MRRGSAADKLPPIDADATAALRATDAALPAISRSETLARQAYRALRIAVRQRALVPGSVYSEAQIARMLHISRTPVREALIELARQGIVAKVPQQGFRLREIGANERREVYDLRAAIESYIVRRLATEATDQQSAALRLMLAAQEKTLSDSRAFDSAAFAEAGERFHLAMPSLIGLERSSEILETLRGVLWLSGTAVSEQRGRPAEALEEHRAIVQAVRKRDPDAAERAVLFHLQMTAQAARQDESQFSEEA